MAGFLNSLAPRAQTFFLRHAYGKYNGVIGTHSQREEIDMKQIRIASAGKKGGVGKTSAVYGLGNVYAHAGKRTLIIDLDPQSNVAFGFGKRPDAAGTAELLMGERPEHIEVARNLRILPGGPALTDRKIQDLDPEDLLDAVKGFEYDVILFDCPPGNHQLERMALTAATVTLVVTDAHLYGIAGARRVIDILTARKAKGRRGCQRWAILMSRLDSRRAPDRQLEEILRSEYPETVLLPLRQDMAIAYAQMNGVPLVLEGPQGQGKGIDDLRAIMGWLNG